MYLVSAHGLALAMPWDHSSHCPALLSKCWGSTDKNRSRDPPFWYIKASQALGTFILVCCTLSYLLPHSISQLPVGHMGLFLLDVWSYGNSVCGLMKERWLCHSSEYQNLFLDICSSQARQNEKRNISTHISKERMLQSTAIASYHWWWALRKLRKERIPAI